MEPDLINKSTEIGKEQLGKIYNEHFEIQLETANMFRIFHGTSCLRYGR